MKNIYKIFSLFLLIGTLMSCEKDSEDISRITYYVDIALEGESSVAIALGEQYAEPGFTAMEGENDVSESVEITSNVDNNQIGVYQVSYSATNQDGFSSSTARTVVVYDPAAPDVDLSGTYNTSVVRTESDGSNPRPRSSSIEITKVGNGVFYVNCLLGYYYAAGYGPAYAMTGYISLNADNTFSLITSHVQGWGDGLEAFNKGTYNATTGELYWESIYAGADIFAATCTK